MKHLIPSLVLGLFALNATLSSSAQTTSRTEATTLPVRTIDSESYKQLCKSFRKCKSFAVRFDYKDCTFADMTYDKFCTYIALEERHMADSTYAPRLFAKYENRFYDEKCCIAPARPTA